MQFLFAEIVCQLPVEAKENEKLYATHELVKLDCMRTESASVTPGRVYATEHESQKKVYAFQHVSKSICNGCFISIFRGND
jgi:hypothetical protein